MIRATASTLSLACLQRRALLSSLPLAAVLGYVIATRGSFAAAAVVAAVGCSAAIVIGLNRLHVALLPLVLIAPLVGYLNVRSPAAGFSAIVDGLMVLPLAALVVRSLIPGRAVDVLGGPQPLVWMFMAVALFQFVNADGTSTSITVYGLRQTVLPMLLFFIGFHLDLSAPGRRRRCAWVLVLSGAIPVLWALKQYFLGLDAAEEVYARQVGTFWVDDDVRVFATFRAPWELAVHAGAVGLVAFSLALAARRSVHRTLAIVACTLGTAALLFTHIRGCLLGYGLGLVFLAVGLVGSRARMRRAWIAFIALVAAYLAFGVFVGPRIVETLAIESVVARRALTLLAPGEDPAVSARLVAWNDLAVIATEHPWGIGLGSTGGVSKRFEEDLPNGAIHPDNAYLAVILETGWVGGALFVALVLTVLVSSVRYGVFGPGDGDAWLRRAGVAYLIMMAVANLAAPLGGHIYWLVSGIMAADAYRIRLASRAVAPRRPPLRAASVQAARPVTTRAR